MVIATVTLLLLPLFAGPAAAQDAAVRESVVQRSGYTNRPCMVGFHWENDIPFDDRFYTNGLRIEERNCVLRGVGQGAGESFADRARRWLAEALPVWSPRSSVVTDLGITIGQNFYTPSEIGWVERGGGVPQEPANYDRPFAAWLYGGVVAWVASERVRHTLELDLGTTGRWAFGGPVQREWHVLIDSDPPTGWEHVVGGDPGVQASWRIETPLNWGRVRKQERCRGARLQAGSESGDSPSGCVETANLAGGTPAYPQIDFTPYAKLELGNIFDRLAVGAQTRFGRLRKRYAFENIAFDAVETRFELYGYARVQAMAIAFNGIIEGDLREALFSDREGFAPRRMVFDGEAGFALTVSDMAVAISYAARSTEVAKTPFDWFYEPFLQVQVWYGRQ